VVNLDQYSDTKAFNTGAYSGVGVVRSFASFCTTVPSQQRGDGMMNNHNVNRESDDLLRSDDLLSKIGEQRTTREYLKKEDIYSQGDAAHGMFYVESGHVKLTVASARGKKAVLAILGKGDFFGQCCLVKGAKRSTTATALQPSTISSVETSALHEIMQRDPKFSSLFVSDLLSRMERVEEDFTDQLLNSSEMRLARLLLRLSHFGESAAADTAVLHVSQGTLAEMVGTTRSRVSFFMNRFRELGLIEYNGTLHVHRALRTFLQQQ
jgi:CRP/FNR family transcriptional regulator, cyclic AMP receptor protein